MKICEKCGMINLDDAKRCIYCKSKFKLIKKTDNPYPLNFESPDYEDDRVFTCVYNGPPENQEDNDQ